MDCLEGLGAWFCVSNVVGECVRFLKMKVNWFEILKMNLAGITHGSPTKSCIILHRLPNSLINPKTHHCIDFLQILFNN
jgi:hypothetical protein